MDAGITDITIVTDQIPEDLTVTPIENDTYGQIAPPKDAPTSWLIGNRVAKALKNEFPKVEFRYRVGTEAGGTNRFAGTQHQYYVHYTRIADGINKHVGADIDVMPFNASGVNTTDTHRNVSIIEIAPNLAFTNRKLAAQPTSFYVSTTPSNTFNKTIEQRLSDMNQYWDAVDAAYGQPVDREIHEFGILNEDRNHVQNAAFHAEGIMRFAQSGLDKFYHWHDTLKQGQLAPTGWLYSVLDSMADGVWTYPTIRVSSSDPESTFFAAVSKKSGKSILLISALNPDVDIVEYKTPNTIIPLSELPALSYAPASTNICMTWVRDSLGTQQKAIDSLTLESLSTIEQATPGVIRNNVFIRDGNLFIRPVVKTNSVTAVVFESNCEGK